VTAPVVVAMYGALQIDVDGDKVLLSTAVYVPVMSHLTGVYTVYQKCNRLMCSVNNNSKSTKSRFSI